MRRWFAVKNRCFPMAAEVAISLVLMLLTALALAPPVTGTRASAHNDQRHGVSG